MDKTYLIHQGNKEDYRVINQTGVKQVITNEPRHNACWDSHLTPDGELYFSVCSELKEGEYAKLYRYDYDTNTAKQCFYTGDIFLKSDRYIRDSKFHTCISTMPDGRLIMVTHTTDKAPDHPAWLPYSFVSNPWEGFPGGELVIYDPKTGAVDLRGIPAPRESIYGGVYSPKDNAYYMLGYMRGHLYRYDLETGKCEDKGQVSEYHTYRVKVGTDGNVYFSTRSGFIMRYNVDTQRVEDLHQRIPCDKGIHRWPYTYLGPAADGPDGRIYITGNFTDRLSALDTKTGSVEAIGKLIPADEYVDNDQQHAMVPGMAFDKYGVLWYATMSFRDNEDEYYKVPAMLFRWDVLNGGEPECLGVFGTVKCAQTFTVALHIDKQRDILYSVSTNHSYSGPDVIAIDLAKFRPVRHIKGEICEDSLIYAPGAQEHKEFADSWHNTKALIREHSAVIKTKKTEAARLWQQVETDEISDAAVVGLRWADNTTLEGLSGKNNFYSFTVDGGKLTSWKAATQDEIKALTPKAPEATAQLPYYPGRIWRSEAICECEWKDGNKLVGTRDGFLARVSDDGSVYSIGPAVCQGPVRCICADLERGVAYGVGGDVEDIGNIFKYDEANGLEYLGYMATDAWDDDIGAAASFVLSACAISPDGKKLAVGACDRLACVYICTLSE